MNNKYELQDKANPHARIVVTSIKLVREMEAHGWVRVEADVKPKVEAKK